MDTLCVRTISSLESETDDAQSRQTCLSTIRHPPGEPACEKKFDRRMISDGPDRLTHTSPATGNGKLVKP
jgi:hypothetical protein